MQTTAAVDRELVFTRLFAAPRATVYQAWTNPKHLVNWWGPNGFTTTIHQMDVRPGGEWRLVMHGPDGRDYHNRLVFLEVVPPKLLVYKHDPEPGSEPVNFETTVTFQSEGEQTRVTMRMVFPTADAKDYVVKTYRADEGGRQTLERLAEHLAASTERKVDLTLKRTFAASPEVVFKAWTDPAQVARWWGPQGFANPVCEMDVRPGGKFVIEMRGPDGFHRPFCGEYIEIVEPRRIVWYVTTPEGEKKARYSIDFVASGTNQTELTLEVEVILFTDATPGILAGMGAGFSQMWDRLAAELSEPVVLTRLFDAPRELVWKVWTDPNHVGHWWGPNGTTNEMHEWDAQAAGRVAFTSMLADGTTLSITGEFVDVKPPERIALITRNPDETGDFKAEMITTVTLEERAGGTTKLTLESRIISTTEPGLYNLANVGSGWSQGLGRMAEELEAIRK